jgi:UDP-N-acetylglucosamine 3-dehydrogenase
MKILLIGLERWGVNHLKALTKLADEVYGADTDPDLKVGGDFAIPPDRFSRDYRDFLDCVEGVDGVTPVYSHRAIGRDCFERRKDVFVEKPIALTTPETREMIIEDEAKVILQVGHLYRYHPACLRIKQLIPEGRLGSVRYAYGHFMGFKRPRADGGVRHTDAIHFFDLFNFLFDQPPQTVTAVVKNYLNRPLDDTFASVLDYQARKTLMLMMQGHVP